MDLAEAAAVRLQTLKPSISDLTQEEVSLLIGEIRNHRLYRPKPKARTKKEEAKQALKFPTDLKDISKLGKKEAEMLLLLFQARQAQ